MQSRRLLLALVRAAAVLTAGSLAVLPLAGCSSAKTISKDRVAAQAQTKFDELARSKGQAGFPKVVCPSDLTAKAGQTTRCSATGPDGTLGITVKVTGVNGSKAHLNFKGDDHLTKK